MSRVRRIVVFALALVALGTARPAEAQLAVSASCYPGVSYPCSFDLSQLAAVRPIELAYFQVDLLGDWSFANTQASGTDLFGPLPPLDASFGATTSSLTVDFLTPLNGPAACFPYDPFTCPFIVGFAVGTAFTPRTFVDLALTRPAALDPGATPDFAWRATDIDGTVYASAPAPTPVDEPTTWVLMATGLGLLLVAGRRRLAA